MSNKPAPREIRILIIAKDVNQFRKHAQFLTRRGWPCDVVGGIKQAVEYVVKHRPMFVMVSFSIPTASITKLPNLLKQTFKATCIAFGEKGDPKTTKRLNACKLQHIFFGALSGPSIHMRIKKILIEMEKEKNKPKGEQGQAPAPDMAAPNPEDFAKANSGRKNPGEVIMKGRNDQSHQNPSMNSAQPGMPPGEGGGDNYWGDKKGGPGQDNSVDYSSQNNSGGGTNSVQPGSYNPQDSGMGMNGQQPGSYNPQGQDAAAMSGAAQANGQDAMGMGDYQEGMDPAQAQPSSFNPQQGNDSSMAAANAAMDAAAMSGAAQANGQDDMGMGDYQQGMDPAQAPAGSMDPQADADFAAAPFQEGHPQDAAATGNSEAAAPAQFTDGFQEEGAANAQEQDRVATGGNRINNGNLTDMAQTFDRIFRMYCDATSDKISPIKEVVSLQAVTIKSETTNGYLLFGTPKDAQMRDGFFADMKENIQHELKSEFLEFYLAENFEIEVERVSFVDWASMAADFISVHQHGESELAMAYFSMDAVPKIKETEFENMCSVGLESVLPNVKANFNGYINFERNNKMLLYIKEGRSISQKQKERLLKKSIDDIYIPTENKENFCSLMAGECLNEKIKHYLDYVKQLKEHAASYAA